MNDALTTLLLIAAPALPLLLALPPLHRRLPWPLLLALLPAAVLVLMPTPAPIALPWFRAGAALGIDPVSRWWLAMSLVAWVCAYSRLPAIDRVSGCTWLLLGLSGQVGTVLAADMASFFSFATLMSYAFVGLLLTERDPAGRHAGQRYLVLLIIADLLLFEAMLLASIRSEHLSFAALAQATTQPGSSSLYPALVVIGYLMKAGLWPLQLWLPRARRSPIPAQSLLLWVGPVTTGLLGALRWLPLGALAAPVAGMLLLMAGTAIGLYALRSWRTPVRQPATVLVCLTTAAVVLVMGAGLMEPALWNPVGGWIPPLVAIAGVTLALISALDQGDRAEAHRPASSAGFDGDRMVHRVQRVATHTLPKLRDAWFGYWRELWHQRRWPQALAAAEQGLRRWRLAVTLLLLLAAVMVALPLGAQS